MTSVHQIFDELIEEMQECAPRADSLGSDLSLRWAGSPPSPAAGGTESRMCGGQR